MTKSIRLTSIILALFMLAACGEGFRGNSASSDGFQANDGGTEFFDQNGRRRSFTSPDLDQEIAQSYSREISTNTTRALSTEIQAFDVILSADQNNNFTMRARIVRGCNDSFEVSRAVQTSVMSSGQIINLGQDGPFEVELQCTASNCEEMVAAIRKVSGSNQGVVLVGLGIGDKDTENRRFLLISRNVSQPGFVRYQHIPGFQSDRGCSVSVNTTEDDDLGERLVEAIVNGDTDELKEIAIEKGIEEGIELLSDIFGF